MQNAPITSKHVFPKTSAKMIDGSEKPNWFLWSLQNAQPDTTNLDISWSSALMGRKGAELSTETKELIDLVTVFDAILKSKQTRQKLQCLYENLISNNFRRTAVLKKIWFVNQSFTPKDSTEKIWGRYMH